MHGVPYRGYAMHTSDHFKCRTLRLANPAHTHRAAALLADTFGIRTRASPQDGQLTLLYTLPQHSLLQMVHHLEQAGIPLARHPIHRLQCQLACYCEQVQLDNLQCPPHATKGREAFSHIYQQHPHGDRDDTPEELRLEK